MPAGSKVRFAHNAPHRHRPGLPALGNFTIQVMPRPRHPGSNGLVSLAPIEQPVVASPSRNRNITRRQALAAAVVTGVGVGVVRLLGGSMQQIASPRAGTTTDWISPLGSESARVMQLLRRTSFGYTQAQLDASLSDGFNKTVDRLIETKPMEPPALAVANTPVGRFPINQLQRRWVAPLLTTPAPFAERMTLFWHGHFTSDYRKAPDDTFRYWHNLTWRNMGMTTLRSMLM